MSNTFFAGCESYMEDDQVVTENTEDTEVEAIQPEEAVAEQTEAADAAEDQVAESAEIEQEAAQAELVFRKFEEIDRMIAYVKTYGVDRSFLSLCNHNQILSKSFGVQLPACESFDAVGSPNSPESIAALESLSETAKKAWEFIKRMCLRLVDWIVRIGKMYDLRLKLLKNKLEKAKSALAKCPDHTDSKTVLKSTRAADMQLIQKQLKDLLPKLKELSQKLDAGMDKAMNAAGPAGNGAAQDMLNGGSSQKIADAAKNLDFSDVWNAVKEFANSEAGKNVLNTLGTAEKPAHEFSKTDIAAVLASCEISAKFLNEFLGRLGDLRKTLSDWKLKVEKLSPLVSSIVKPLISFASKALTGINWKLGSWISETGKEVNFVNSWIAAASKKSSEEKKDNK